MTVQVVGDKPIEYTKELIAYAEYIGANPYLALISYGASKEQQMDLLKQIDEIAESCWKLNMSARRCAVLITLTLIDSVQKVSKGGKLAIMPVSSTIH